MSTPIEPSGELWIRSALERFERPLTQYAARLLGDLDAARDAVQETFLRLCQKPREEVEGHLGEWLFTVCRNLSLDVRRKEQRMKPLGEENALRADGQESLRAIEDGREQLRAVDERDTLSHVAKKIASLPERQREVLRLKFQHGLSYREISRITDENIGTVGYLIHLGIQNLRGKLASEEAKGAGA